MRSAKGTWVVLLLTMGVISCGDTGESRDPGPSVEELTARLRERAPVMRARVEAARKMLANEDWFPDMVRTPFDAEVPTEFFDVWVLREAEGPPAGNEEDSPGATPDRTRDRRDEEKIAAGTEPPHREESAALVRLRCAERWIERGTGLRTVEGGLDAARRVGDALGLRYLLLVDVVRFEEPRLTMTSKHSVVPTSFEGGGASFRLAIVDGRSMTIVATTDGSVSPRSEMEYEYSPDFGPSSDGVERQLRRAFWERLRTVVRDRANQLALACGR